MKDTKSPRLGLGCMVAALAALLSTVVFMYFNWGFWRSKAYELTGVDFPLDEVYRTDLSGRGRDAGFFVVVYRLPNNIANLLRENDIDLSLYPMFVAGFERDDYRRITWTKDFPRNEVEEEIFRYFAQQDRMSGDGGLDGINSDEDAIDLANALIQETDTLYGGWHKYGRRYANGDVWIPDFCFYLMNIEGRALIMFWLQT